MSGQSVPDKRGKVWIRYAYKHGESMPHVKVSIAEHLIWPGIEAEAALYRDPDERAGSVATQRVELLARRQRVIEMRVDGLLDRSETARRVAEIDAEVGRLSAPRPKATRLVQGWTPGEVNTVLRQLFERIDLDPTTLHPLPSGFVWRNPAWCDPA